MNKLDSLNINDLPHTNDQNDTNNTDPLEKEPETCANLSEETNQFTNPTDEFADLNNKYLRLYAEFDNFKRRTNKERLEWVQTASKNVIISLLTVMDDCERGLKSIETSTDPLAVKEGLLLIYNKLKNILQQKGLKEMPSLGQAFDADLHEAITNIPAPTDDLKGKVIDELEKGYYLNEKVIRYAKVVVGN